MNSVSAKVVQTVTLLGMWESIPMFYEKFSAKGMCGSLKVLSPY